MRMSYFEDTDRLYIGLRHVMPGQRWYPNANHPDQFKVGEAVWNELEALARERHQNSNRELW